MVWTEPQPYISVLPDTCAVGRVNAQTRVPSARVPTTAPGMS